MLPFSERSRRWRSGEVPRRKRSGQFVASIREVAALYRLPPAIWGGHPETSYSCQQFRLAEHAVFAQLMYSFRTRGHSVRHVSSR